MTTSEALSGNYRTGWNRILPYRPLEMYISRGFEHDALNELGIDTYGELIDFVVQKAFEFGKQTKNNHVLNEVCKLADIKVEDFKKWIAGPESLTDDQYRKLREAISIDQIAKVVQFLADVFLDENLQLRGREGSEIASIIAQKNLEQDTAISEVPTQNNVKNGAYDLSALVEVVNEINQSRSREHDPFDLTRLLGMINLEIKLTYGVVIDKAPSELAEKIIRGSDLLPIIREQGKEAPTLQIKKTTYVLDPKGIADIFDSLTSYFQQNRRAIIQKGLEMPSRKVQGTKLIPIS